MNQNDDFIAAPITQTGIQILTPSKAREVYADVFEHDGANYAVYASEPRKELYLSMWKRTSDDDRQIHLPFAKPRWTLMMRLAKFKAKPESRRSYDPRIRQIKGGKWSITVHFLEQLSVHIGREVVLSATGARKERKTG